MAKPFREIKRITRQSLPFLLISGAGELAAGVVLSIMLRSPHMVPGVLVLLPSLMNLRGAISSTFAARLGSAYHLGLMRRGKFFNRTVKESMKSSFVLAFISSVVLAVLAYFISRAFGFAVSLVFFLFRAVVASLLSALILSIVTVFITRYSIKKKMDPDNVTIPVITTVGDIFLIILVGFLMLAFVEVFP
jgi:mgtE-like transporter